MLCNKNKRIVALVGLICLFVLYVAQPDDEEVRVNSNFVQIAFKDLQAPICPEFTDLTASTVTVRWPDDAIDDESDLVYELYLREVIAVPMDYIKIYSGNQGAVILSMLDANTYYSVLLKVVYTDKTETIVCKMEFVTPQVDNVVKNPSFEEIGSPEYYDLLYVHHEPSALSWQPFSLGYFLSGKVENAPLPPQLHTGQQSMVMHIGVHDDYTWDNNGAYQHVYLNQTVATPFTLSAWSYGNGVTGGPDMNWAVVMDFWFQDGTHLYDQHVSFDPKKDKQWQQKCLIIEPIKPVLYVGILAVFRGPHSGTVYFDDIMLWPQSGIPRDYQRKTICRRSSANSAHLDHLVIRPFLLKAQESPRTNDVSILTQLSVDRLDRLELMANAYRGPISAAVYIKDKDRDFIKLQQAIEQNENVRQYVDFHIVYDDQEEYPSNQLRNVAKTNCRTELGLILDVDFVPSVDAREILQSLYPLMIQEPKSLFVIAAFEANSTHPPKNLEDLVKAVKKGKVSPVHLKKTFHSHGPTDYNRWYYAEEIYQVDYDLFYEPYIIINTRTTPDFEERFRGYGHDKESQSYELDKAGYKFFVLPSIFATHVNHPEAEWKPDTNWLRVEKNWYDFVVEMAHRYPDYPRRSTWLIAKLIEEGQLPPNTLP